MATYTSTKTRQKLETNLLYLNDPVFGAIGVERIDNEGVLSRNGGGYKEDSAQILASPEFEVIATSDGQGISAQGVHFFNTDKIWGKIETGAGLVLDGAINIAPTTTDAKDAFSELLSHTTGIGEQPKKEEENPQPSMPQVVFNQPTSRSTAENQIVELNLVGKGKEAMSVEQLQEVLKGSNINIVMGEKVGENLITAAESQISENDRKQARAAAQRIAVPSSSNAKGPITKLDEATENAHHTTKAIG